MQELSSFIKELPLVNFEQAKKLKQMDFDWACNDYFKTDFIETVGLKDSFAANHNKKTPGYVGSHERYSRPTVALALQWLRQQKKLLICVYFLESHKESEPHQYYYKFFPEITNGIYNIQVSYEMAESVGLDLALDYYINQK